MKISTINTPKGTTREINAALNKRLSMDDQFNSFVIDVTINAGQEYAIVNRLRKNNGLIPPKEWAVIDAAGASAGDLKRGPTAWTAEKLYLKNTGIKNGTFRIRFMERVQTGTTLDATITAPDEVMASEVRVDTGDGHGSSSTFIRNITNTQIDKGSCITYADSSTLGTSFTINSAGIYSMTYQDYRGGGLGIFGVSVNATGSSLTTSVSSLDYADGVKGFTESRADKTTNFAITMALETGDIVRPHTDGTPDTTGEKCFFHIVRVA